MPGFDKTGPEGKGQGTGRRLGPCHRDSEKPRSGIGRRRLRW